MIAAESKFKELQNHREELSRADISAECVRRLGSALISSEDVFAHPLEDFDIFEDESCLINRLYYIVPALRASRLELFVFFEENRFEKDEDGELVLRESGFYIEELG